MSHAHADASEKNIVEFKTIHEIYYDIGLCFPRDIQWLNHIGLIVRHNFRFIVKLLPSKVVYHMIDSELGIDEEFEWFYNDMVLDNRNGYTLSLTKDSHSNRYVFTGTRREWVKVVSTMHYYYEMCCNFIQGRAMTNDVIVQSSYNNVIDKYISTNHSDSVSDSSSYSDSDSEYVSENSASHSKSSIVKGVPVPKLDSDSDTSSYICSTGSDDDDDDEKKKPYQKFLQKLSDDSSYTSTEKDEDDSIVDKIAESDFVIYMDYTLSSGSLLDTFIGCLCEIYRELNPVGNLSPINYDAEMTKNANFKIVCNSIIAAYNHFERRRKDVEKYIQEHTPPEVIDFVASRYTANDGSIPTFEQFLQEKYDGLSPEIAKIMKGYCRLRIQPKGVDSYDSDN